MATAGANLLLLLFLSSVLVSTTANMIAIDLGSEYLKVASIKPGKVPIQIVVNEMSRRKSPALVGLVPAGDAAIQAGGGSMERVIGEEAFSFSVRFPETSFSRARDLLTRPPGHPLVSRMIKDHLLPFDVVAHPNRSACASVRGGPVGDAVAIHSAEELVASIFQYAKDIAVAHTGAPVTDAVIAVPAFFGQAQRQALVEAAGLAGLNVMGLINTHAAAALQFGIERDFSNKTQNLILYDMGSGSTEVALVRYSSYPAKDAAGKATRVSQLEVRDVDWDHELGSNLLDVVLARHFTARFAEKFKFDLDAVLGSPKAMAKMKKQVRRTKEMLSANNAAPISVEEFYEGKDFQSSITREDFETLVSGFFERAAAPLLRIIERNSLKPEDVDAVELLGGGSRVPRLQAVLSEALGGRGLDRHLDADEATVLGASLFAANLSTSFRLRKFGLTDLSMYGIQLSVDEVHQTLDPNPEDPAASSPATTLRGLLPPMKKLPVKRLVTFVNVTRSPIKISLAYNTTSSLPHGGLPPGVDEPALAAFEISGVEKAIERYNTSGTVTLKFEADFGGVLRLDKAEAVVEYVVMEEKVVEVKPNKTASNASDANATTVEGEDTSNSTAEEVSKEGDASSSSNEKDAEGNADGDVPSPSSEEKEGGGDESAAAGANSTTLEDQEEGDANTTSSNATKAASSPPTIKRIQVPKKKVAKVALTIEGPGWSRARLTGADLASSKATLAAWVRAETIKRDTAAAKNDLESYIIKTREAMETDELLMKVTTEEQRISFIEQLTAMEDWLYSDEGESQAAPEFKSKLKSLKEVGEPMKARAEESELRPKLLEHLRKELDLKSKIVKAWTDTKPWINATEQSDVLKALNDFSALVDLKEEEQSKKLPQEEPAFLVNDLATRFEQVAALFNKINNKRKPKPPPAPPAANTTNTTNTTNDTESSSSATEGESSSSKAGQEEKQGEGKAEAEKKPSSSSGAEGRKKAEDAKKEAAAAKKAAEAAKKKEADAKAKEAAKKKEEAKKAEEAKKKAEAAKKAAEAARKKEEAAKKAKAEELKKKAEAAKGGDTPQAAKATAAAEAKRKEDIKRKLEDAKKEKGSEL